MTPNYHEGRPPHPKYGAPLSGAPKVIEGITFRPYSTGIQRSCWISDDFRIAFDRSTYRNTYHASVDDGESGKGGFRKPETAVRWAKDILAGRA